MYPRFTVWELEEGGVNVCQPGREELIEVLPRFALVMVFVVLFRTFVAEFIEVPGRALFIVLAGRFAFDELGGVNVCQPGRADVIEEVPPRFALVMAFVTLAVVFVLEFPPRAPFGVLMAVPPRTPFIVVAGPDVPTGRVVELTLLRAENPFVVAGRDVEKNRCVLDGAFR